MDAHFTVVYDACVLYPAPVRDFLIRLARTGMFRARWSDAIHEEWISSLLKNRDDLTREKLERTRRLMNESVPGCLVRNFEHFIDGIGLNDRNDRHVVAAAIRAGAELIITFNLKHFPDSSLERYNLSAQHPDDFIADLIDLNYECVVKTAAQHRHQLVNPHKNAKEYIDTLFRHGLTQTAAALREFEFAL
jgi:predicted nucleic acid-binding protein